MDLKPLLALALFLALLSSGCTLSRRGEQPQEPAATSALIRDSPGVPGNTCTTQYIQCPQGQRVLAVSCSSGYNSTPECPKIDSGKRFSDLQLVNLESKYGEYGCYWQVREKYDYGEYFDPFQVCEQKRAGWSEACDCLYKIKRGVNG